VLDYSHADGIAVVGGYVYRGSAIPSLVGSYVFADYGNGAIWRVVYDANNVAKKELLFGYGTQISSFGEGLDGELYVVAYGPAGVISKIVPAAGGGPPPSAFPQTLSASGCVDDNDPSRPAGNMVPYDINAPLWSDGAGKRRWVALPPGGRIHIADDGHWDLPIGTVLVKEFSLGNKRVETRLLVHHDDGDWAGYSYE